MEKTGELFGVVPYDLRPPTWERIKERMWNPGDERIVMPRVFGAGWTLNFYRLRERYPILFYLLVAAAALRIVWGFKKLFKRQR